MYFPLFSARMRPLLPVVLLAVAPSMALRAEDSDDEIAKKLSNPVASLISVPFQANWDFGMGPLDKGEQFKLNFQPVVPLLLNDDWHLIIRTIIPYISQEDVYTSDAPKFPGLSSDVLGRIPRELRNDAERRARRAFDAEVDRRFRVDRHQDGLSDISQSFFLSPTKGGPGGMVIGIGPIFSYPTATDDLLGTEKWSAGPSLLVLKQEHGWTYGMLANHLWSFAGNEDRSNVNLTFVQPFLSYQTKTKTTIGVNAEATYDWNESQWTVPINGFVSQLVRIGKMPVSFTVGGRYYAEGPSGAPEWGLRFVVTLVFPEGRQAAASGEGKSYRK